MILLYLILAILFVPGYQVRGKNCLRDNAGVLDADFSILNRFEDHYDFDETDISNHVNLFTARFKRGHTFVGLSREWRKKIGLAVSLFNRVNHKKFELFLNVPVGKHFSNVTNGIQQYQEDYQIVLDINSGNPGPVVGLYVGFRMETLEAELEALEAVFGPKENSTFPIGIKYKDCLRKLKIKAGKKLIQRLDFLTCDIYPNPKSSGKVSADEVIRNCQKMQAALSSLEITVVFMCRTSYPTFGTSDEGVVGSVSNFQSFWCRIVEQVIMNKALPRIIMQSSFDDTPGNYKSNTTKLINPVNHFGWWRRRETISYEATAFVEKIEELEGSGKSGNCTELCSPCNSDDECCGSTYCESDNSFQPFEKGPPQYVCKTILSTCAPRPPKISPEIFTSPTEATNKSIFSNQATFPASSLPPSVVATDTKSTSTSSSESGSSILSDGNIFVFVGCILLVVIGAIGFFFFRREKSKRVLTQQELRLFFDGCSSPVGPQAGLADTQGTVGNLPYDKQLEISTQDFEIREDQFLGSGAFGVVFKGILGNEVVAVKTTLPEVDKIYFKSLLLELKVLMYLGKHENIVNLLGAHTAQLNSAINCILYLFLEICSMGNLLELLRSHREDFLDGTECEQVQMEGEEFQLTCKHLLQWSVQIASAMEHLADKRVIHADIAARNVLVFSTTHVKLTDFGLSRRLYEYAHYVKKSQEPLPWRHMSVEALRDMNFSVQSDIWSFGVTLWEIFSLGNVPYPGHSMSDDFVEFLVCGLILNCPKHAHPLIYEIMKSCWKIDVKSRPPINLVHSNLTSAFNEMYTKSQYYNPRDI